MRINRFAFCENGTDCLEYYVEECQRTKIDIHSRFLYIRPVLSTVLRLHNYRVILVYLKILLKTILK